MSEAAGYPASGRNGQVDGAEHTVASSEPGPEHSDVRNMILGDGGHDGRDIFFAAMQLSRMPMCLSDPHQPDSPLVFCNRAFEELTGYEQHEILGRNCRFLQGKDTDPAMIDEIRRGIAAGEDVQLEILNYRKDGSSFWNALFVSPVIDSRGRLVYYFASQLNVTRRHEADAILQQSRRMETLGGMASSLAHEFNNLMTIVLASLERASQEFDAARRDRQLGRAMWGAQRAARLTDQMLSFARRQFHDNQTLDVNEMLRNFDSILDQMAGSDVTVVLELAPEPLAARIDPGQMELALLNLVRNAADAIPQGGRIVVSTRLRRYDDVTGAAAVEIAVSDTGVGMAPEVVRRATEPFFTTKERGKGTGLGLSMVNGFAEQSDGRMEIESVPGAGTTVRLVFPIRAR